LDGAVKRIIALALLLFAMPTAAAPKEAVQPTGDWRKVATPADKSRLMRWRVTMVAALASADRDGEGEAITREGALLLPDAGLERPAIPAGNYECRSIKIGRKGSATKPVAVRPASPCTLSEKGARMRLMVLSGNQRARGDIFPGNERRQIFLGSIALGDETRAMDYGRDGARDMAGSLERIGDNRWRLLLPEPGFDAQMEVIEITPAG
jgi:Domain of unknown function (DUF4893)